MYNNWEKNVDSWMGEDNLRKHYTFLDQGRKQKAHQLAHRAFHAYLFQLSGCRYLLQMLLQLPILPQCSAAQPAFGEVPALTTMIADLEEHQQTPRYQAAVAQSTKRSSEHSRLSQQIWQQSKQVAKAKALSRKARLSSWHDLTQEEQGWCKRIRMETWKVSCRIF